MSRSSFGFAATCDCRTRLRLLQRLAKVRSFPSTFSMTKVRAIARSKERLHTLIPAQERLHVIEASILDLSDAEMQEAVSDCDAIASTV